MLTYFFWWFYIEPIYLWRSINITTRKVFYIFSIPILLKTLFSPWKKDTLYKENPSLSEMFQIWSANLTSRLIGFLVRFATIFAGLLLASIVFIVGFIFLICWFLLPIIIIFLLVDGAKNING